MRRPRGARTDTPDPWSPTSPDPVQARFDRWIGFLAGAAIGAIAGLWWTLGEWDEAPLTSAATLLLAIVGFGLASLWLRDRFWDELVGWSHWRW